MTETTLFWEGGTRVKHIEVSRVPVVGETIRLIDKDGSVEDVEVLRVRWVHNEGPLASLATESGRANLTVATRR